MRVRGTRRLAVLVTLVAGTASVPAHGDDRRPLDVGDIEESLVVLHDGHGHYVAVDTFGDSDDMFYGDGKDFVRQRVFAMGSNSASETMSRRFWSPRSEVHGSLELDRGRSWSIRCDKRTTPLVELGDEEASKLLGGARFHRPSFDRLPYALARDDHGRYYFVDKSRDRFVKGFRLFVGKRGAMTEKRLTDVISDSGGDIFATRRGDFHVVRSREGGESLWIRGKKKVPLVTVPVEKNALLIYADLGVYSGPLGTPCDDM